MTQEIPETKFRREAMRAARAAQWPSTTGQGEGELDALTALFDTHLPLGCSHQAFTWLACSSASCVLAVPATAAPDVRAFWAALTKGGRASSTARLFLLIQAKKSPRAVIDAINAELASRPTIVAPVVPKGE